MSLRLHLYLGAVILTAAGLLALEFHDARLPFLGHYLAWIAICVLSETLQVSTLSGEGNITMASTAGLAAAMLWGVAPAMLIAMVSTAIADALIWKKPWIRVVFNAFQIVVTTWVAASVFHGLGGPEEGLGYEGFLGRVGLEALPLALPVVGLCAGYLLANRTLVAGAVSLSTERSFVRVLREDWFYLERLSQDLAAFLLSPLMVISFRTVDYPGVALFFAPLWLLNKSALRYIELQRAQNQMIHTERMAAKGEMAAEIGHELRNQLAAISGRAQLLKRRVDRNTLEGAGKDVQVILDQALRMERLSKGLMDFSGADEMKLERVELNGLIQRTIEFVSAQNRFDRVEWELDLANPSPELRVDPGQLQQVLLNLFMNAADAMNERERQNGAMRKMIAVTTGRNEKARGVQILVADSGCGIPASNLTKIFEPHFTTKPDGHGFGLSTSYRIITNHGGRITADSTFGQGARFTITLPATPAGLN